MERQFCCMKMSESQLRPENFDESDTQTNIRRNNVSRNDSLHASNHKDENEAKGGPHHGTKLVFDATVDMEKKFDQSGKGNQQDSSEKQTVSVNANTDDKNKNSVGTEQGKPDDTESSSGANVKGTPEQLTNQAADETVDKNKEFDQSDKGNQQVSSEKQRVGVDVNTGDKNVNSVGTTKGKTDDTERSSGANIEGNPKQCAKHLFEEKDNKNKEFNQSGNGNQQDSSEKPTVGVNVNTDDKNKNSVGTEQGKPDDTESSSGANVKEESKQCINPVLDELVEENNEFDQSGKGHQKDSSETESNMSDKNKISGSTTQGKTDDTESSSGAHVNGNSKQCTEHVPDETVDNGEQKKISVDMEKGKTDDIESQGDPKQFTKPALGETIDKNKEFDQSGKGNQQDSGSVDINMGDKNKISVGTAQGKTADTECSPGANVKEIPSKFTEKLTEKHVKEKDTLKLSCKHNKHDVHVIWYKDGKVIKSDDRTKISDHMYQHELVIGDLKLNDAGKYKCECGGASTECSVGVEAQFTDILTDQVVKEEGQLVMKCKLNKLQVPVKWLINDKRIEEKEYGKRIKITKDGLYCCLVLIHAKLSDAGQYACVCDEDRTDCKVKVEEIPSEFTENLTEQHVKEKETMKLSCKLNKHDVPAIWYKDGKVIKSDDRTIISDHMYQHELVIRDLKLNDAGKYMCECGGTSTECSVGVEGSFLRTLQTTIQTALRKWSPLLLIAFSVLLSFVINQTMSSLRSDIHISSTHKILPLVQKLESIERAVSTVKDERILQKKDLLGTLQKYQSEILQDRETKFKELSEKLENVKHEIKAKADADDIGKMKEKIENKAIEMEVNFANTMAEIQKSVTDRTKDFTKSLEEFKSRVANYQASFESFEKETTEKTEKVKKSLSSLNVTVEQDLKTILQEVKVQLSGIKKAKQEADVILRHTKNDVDRIVPNTFNKEALTAAFLVLVVLVFLLALWIYKIQNTVANGDVPDRNQNMVTR